MEVYIKLYVKIAEKLKMLNFRQNIFFMNFQDMIIWFDLGEKTSLGGVSKKISYSQNPYCWRAPSFCPHRREKAFLRDFFNFRANFHILVQQVLTKLFRWQESPELILQNPNFDFFISCLAHVTFSSKVGNLSYEHDKHSWTLEMGVTRSNLFHTFAR